MDKPTIRAKIQASLRTISASDRALLSIQATDRLLEQSIWHHSHQVLAFLAFKDELDLFPALEAGWSAGKTIALPRYNPPTGTYHAAITFGEKHTFVKGSFGVLEPPPDAPVLPLNRLDLVLVPGLAFDP